MPERLPELYLDNPIEFEKIPPDPLTVEFVAEPEDVSTTVLLWTATVMTTFALFIWTYAGGQYLVPMLPPDSQFLPNHATILGCVLMVFWSWSLNHSFYKRSPWFGFALATGFMLVAMLNFSNQVILAFATAIMMVYALNDIILHFSLVRKRWRTPILDAPLPDDTKETLLVDFLELALLVSMVASSLRLIPESDYGFLVPMATTAFVGWVAMQKFKIKKVDPRLSVKAAYTHLGAYPDAPRTAPGLLKTPLLPQSFRGVPVAYWLFTVLAWSWAAQSLTVLALSIVSFLVCFLVIVAEFKDA